MNHQKGKNDLKFNPTDYKKRNIVIWNEVAPRYHKRWASISQGPFASTSKLVQLLDIKKGDRVFDLACGTGVVTKRIRQKVGRSGFVIGGDTSVTAIKIAKKWNDKNLNLDFVNVDAETFRFSKKFDVISCQYALFFFPNAQKALKNMKKHLQKGGKLGITVHGGAQKVPFFSSIFDAVTEFIPDYVPPGSPNLDRFGTKTALKNEVKKAGFSKINVQDFNFNFNPGKFETYWQNYLKYLAKPLKEKLDSLDKKQRKELKSMVRENVKSFTQKDGTVKFPWEVLILTAKNKD
ncbi:MAG: methyltransferase domain-containing protein [Nitrosopumilaceae archaeon]